ncbi:restriction endonuclease subunit S [Clostridium tarantellae]|uniref:Restriction endonuclease subunit S n=2 Tax=Clostridium tarantellae TaxID=39493 RepID=A0A6I1MS83_9CLOT|nr:restriction endonuclease subunit S [Clostridium tarantellae]
MMNNKYKDSGIKWIGYIPEHWEIQRIKSVLVERKENNNPIKTEFILSLTNDRGVIPYNDKGDIGNKSKQELTEYRLAYPNDIVLNSMNIVIGSVGLSNYFGAVSPVYYMLYKRNKEDSIRYFNYLFQTKPFQNNLRGYGNGIMEIRMRIQMSKLNTVLLPYPPVIEQRKIADYLDKKIHEIDNIIRNTKISIDEYKKYKKSIIIEATIKGIQKGINFKKSNIDYLGYIPENWIVRRLKYVLTPLSREVLDTDDVVTCFRNGEVTLRKNRKEEGYTFSNTENGYQGVEDDDLVIHGMDAFAGAIGISDSRGKCSPVVHICDSKENKRYYMYFLRALALNDVFMALSDGVRIRSSDFRNWTKLAKFFVVVPPIEEQEKIVEFLDKKCNKIDELIKQKQLLLIEIDKYKKSLIYECVTGKMEVK